MYDDMSITRNGSTAHIIHYDNLFIVRIYRTGNRTHRAEFTDHEDAMNYALDEINKPKPPTIHDINASLYDTCPNCGKSKPTASTRCIDCFSEFVATR